MNSMPYGVRHLLDDAAHDLTSVVAWESSVQNVLVGTATGTLLHFSSSSTSSVPTLCDNRKLHSSAIVQLCAAKVCDALVVLLADGAVMLHKLGTLEPRGPVADAMDCASLSLLTLHKDARLAAAKMKAVSLYRWRVGSARESNGDVLSNGSFELVSEISLSEPLRFLSWATEDQLWLALGQR